MMKDDDEVHIYKSGFFLKIENREKSRVDCYLSHSRKNYSQNPTTN